MYKVNWHFGMHYLIFRCYMNKVACLCLPHCKLHLPHVTWHCLAVGWGRPGWLAQLRRKTSVTYQWRCGSPWTCLRCIAVRVKHQGRPGRLNTKGCSRHSQQQDRSDLDLVAQHLCQPRYSKFLWIGNTARWEGKCRLSSTMGPIFLCLWVPKWRTSPPGRQTNNVTCKCLRDFCVLFSGLQCMYSTG